MNKEQFIARFSPRFGRYSVICGVVALLLWLSLMLIPVAVGIYIPPALNLIGLALGIAAIINRHPGKYPPSGLAWFGCLFNLAIFVIAGWSTAQINNIGYDKNHLLLGAAVTEYAQAHDGTLPTSLSQVVGMPNDRIRTRWYYFYTIHTERWLALNRNLAGQKLDRIAYPERTIVIAPVQPGNHSGYFSRPEEINQSPHSYISFLDAGRYPIRAGDDLARHLYPVHSTAKDHWFVYPVFKQHGVTVVLPK